MQDKRQRDMKGEWSSGERGMDAREEERQNVDWQKENERESRASRKEREKEQREGNRRVNRKKEREGWNGNKKWRGWRHDHRRRSMGTGSH